MPADRKCWDDVEVRSVDDVQRHISGYPSAVKAERRTGKDRQLRLTLHSLYHAANRHTKPAYYCRIVNTKLRRLANSFERTSAGLTSV